MYCTALYPPLPSEDARGNLIAVAGRSEAACLRRVKRIPPSTHRPSPPAGGRLSRRCAPPAAGPPLLVPSWALGRRGRELAADAGPCGAADCTTANALCRSAAWLPAPCSRTLPLPPTAMLPCVAKLSPHISPVPKTLHRDTFAGHAVRPGGGAIACPFQKQQHRLLPKPASHAQSSFHDRLSSSGPLQCPCRFHCPTLGLGL